MTRTIKILTLLAVMIITAVTAGAQEKKTPVVTTPPTASPITYGENLTYSSLSGTATGENNEALSGTWMWASPSTMPKVSDSGTTEYSVIFTPTDYTNYEECTTTTTLTVNPKAITITAASDSWTYDGNAHSNTAVTVTSGSLLDGHQLVATATGSVTNVADTQEGNNPIAAGYKIMNGEEDVTANYAITTVAGTLTINPKPTNTEALSYIDENGETKSKDVGTVTVLDGTETYLDAGWYVCNSENLSYTATIRLKGEVHLILADGKTMNVGTSESRIDGHGIMYSNYDGGQSLTIYGQTGGTGALNVYVTGDNRSAISAQSVTINGGKVEVTGTYTGISAIDNVTINGGQVTATGTYGIYASRGDITIGWKNATDFIKTNNYNVYNGKAVKTVDGQRFVAYNMANESDISASAIVSGTVDNVSTLAGKTLKPLEGNYVSINAGDFDFTGTTSTTSPFTITTGEGENETTTYYYLYNSDDPVTLSYTGSGFVNVTGATLAAVANQPMQRTFTMPATDVELTATAITGLSISGTYTYNCDAQTPVIMIGDDVFEDTNYTLAFKRNNETVSEARSAGTYDVTITGLGQYIGTASETFIINKGDGYISIEASTLTKTYGDEDFTIEVTVVYTTGAVTYASDNTDCATVVKDNNDERKALVHIVGVGKTKITITVAEDDNYDGDSKDILLTVNPVLFATGTTNTWMTWCDKNVYTLPEGCTAYTISSINGTTMNLSNALATIPAYTPVLIKRTEGDLSGNITAGFVETGTVPDEGYNATTGLASSEGSGYTFYGNASDAAITEGDFTGQPAYSLYNGRFYRYEGTQAIAAHRCLLTLSPVYNAPVLVLSEGATNIKTTDYTDYTDKADAWYTLDGRKLDGMPTKKGIYINNGKKTVIK